MPIATYTHDNIIIYRFQIICITMIGLQAREYAFDTSRAWKMKKQKDVVRGNQVLIPLVLSNVD